MGWAERIDSAVARLRGIAGRDPGKATLLGATLAVGGEAMGMGLDGWSTELRTAASAIGCIVWSTGLCVVATALQVIRERSATIKAASK